MQAPANSGSYYCNSTRNELTKFFMTPQGEISRQYKHI
jgi:hypothetical protein